MAENVSFTASNTLKVLANRKQTYVLANQKTAKDRRGKEVDLCRLVQSLGGTIVCPTVDQSTASYTALDISTNENAALNIMGCFIAFGWQQWLGFSTPSRKDTSIGSVYRGKLISGNKITAS